MVTAAAGFGAAALTLFLAQFGFWWTFAHPNMTTVGNTLTGLVYLPLVAWGPLLAAVTIGYHRRRQMAGA
ncbi:hypothetical protein ACFXPS_44075 [Nocardia sp. NPDC059091]|uniref:hypothetical protein n=1 Tax=unclassified Nocardia TaxID=2637762 RepID=UPI00369C2C48